MRAIGWLALCLGLYAVPAHAIPRFALPVDCALGEDCIIQNHFDHNAAEGVFQDYACGALGYDGHTGTDIRMRHIGALAGEGVDVLAAADGRVERATTYADISSEDVPLLKLIKRAVMRGGCGQGVTVDHGTGWRSHYCHMREGSVSVSEGDAVKAGDRIGKMGMTGTTVFPHLHFEVSHYGLSLDPFVAQAKGYDCTQTARASLWQPELQKQLAYIPSGVVDAGFTVGEPQIAIVRQTGARPLTSLSETNDMGVWAELFGLQHGDAVSLEVTAPDGTPIAQQGWRQDEVAAIRLFAVTVAARDTEWQTGEYRAALRVTREGKTAISHTWATELQ